jgi:hypothetical protein
MTVVDGPHFDCDRQRFVTIVGFAEARHAQNHRTQTSGMGVGARLLRFTIR